MEETAMDFELEAREVHALIQGEIRPLFRKDKPEVKVGTTVDLAHTKKRKIQDKETGTEVTIDPEPVLTFIVREVVRRAKGGWAIYYELIDKRQQPPVYLSKSGYTLARSKAIDEQPALLDKKARAKVDAETRYAAIRRLEEDKEKRGERDRKQRKAFQQELRDVFEQLGPHRSGAKQELMADLGRTLARHLPEETQKAA